MSLLADLLSTLIERRAAVGQGADDRPIEDLCRDLLGSRGEVSGYALVAAILDRYDAMDDAGKLAFFRFLNDEMDIDHGAVAAALAAYGDAPSQATYRAFMAAAEPARQELARRLNQVPGATARLVAMRADLLRLIGQDAALAKLDLDFRHLLSSWFNRGFLVLRPVTWSSPAKILEDIISYEAVHAIDSWDDLRRRVQPADRRCFAFFHPAMPDEPLIFVEVALTKGVPGSIQAVLAGDRAALDPAQADTATFYSISNCQAGLAGISFGNSLIKQVAEDLSRALPQLETFVTLSPIPGLAAWMQANLVKAQSAAEQRLIAAHYLLNAKRPNGTPLDPVARFHLQNGASVMDIHAGADTSARGQSLSGGAMVNYRYDLGRVADNHEAFVHEAQVIAAPEIVKLAAQPLPDTA
jgi:malonyl-CoA decarboxylase